MALLVFNDQEKAMVYIKKHVSELSTVVVQPYQVDIYGIDTVLTLVWVDELPPQEART